MDDHAVPKQSRPGTALDHALDDVATGNGPSPGHLEDRPHLGGAEDLFHLLGGELTDQELFDLVEELVDDPVGADLHSRLLGGLARLGLGADVEADDHGIGDFGEADVVLVDTADRAVDDLDLPAFALDLGDRVPQGLERPLCIGLDDDVEGGLLGAKLIEEGLEPVSRRWHRLADRLGLFRSLLGDVARLTIALDDLEVVTGGGNVVPSHDLHRCRGPGRLDLGPAVVGQCPDPAGDGPGHEGITGAQGAPLHDHRGYGSLALLHLGLYDHSRGVGVRVGLVVLELGNQVDDLEEVVDPGAGQRRQLDAGDVAAQLLGDDVVLGQLGPDPQRVGTGEVDLVDGDDHLHLGGLGVRDRLGGLRHHPVVSRHDEDDDVGDVGPTRPQRGERLVTRGVDECDRVTVDLDLIGPDVLGDPTLLSLGDGGLANGVEQSGLAMVDMSHHRHHRGAGHQVSGLVLVDRTLGNHRRLRRGCRLADLDHEAEGLRHRLDLLDGHHLADSHRLAAHQQLGYDIGRGDADGRRELGHGGSGGDGHDLDVPGPDAWGGARSRLCHRVAHGCRCRLGLGLRRGLGPGFRRCLRLRYRLVTGHCETEQLHRFVIEPRRGGLDFDPQILGLLQELLGVHAQVPGKFIHPHASAHLLAFVVAGILDLILVVGPESPGVF